MAIFGIYVRFLGCIPFGDGLFFKNFLDYKPWGNDWPLDSRNSFGQWPIPSWTCLHEISDIPRALVWIFV